jgi:ABC-type uncharacterized transport system substrate-binding protein
MRRREFIALAAGVTTLWSLGTRAEGAERVRHIGVLSTTRDNDLEWQREIAAFIDELRTYGWNDGGNCKIHYRFGTGSVDGLAKAAGELMAIDPDVIVARSTPAIKALVAYERAIPIIFVSVADPVGEGFAATMARPGGHVTGFTNFEASLGGKWVELLKEAAPHIRRIVVIYNPELAVAGGSYHLGTIEAAARSHALELVSIKTTTGVHIEGPLNALAREGDGIVVIPDPVNVTYRALIIQIASRRKLPAIYPFRNMAVEGGLVSYGVSLTDLYRRSAEYVDRILKGTSVGELPIQAPSKFELVVNLKTARALGLIIPAALLSRADEVIE